MLVTGIILAPAAIATPAVQDLINLRTVVNAAANTIGDQKNPNRGWGFGGGSGMGTADLVNNITTTVLRMKFEIDTNKTAWLLPSNITDATTNITAPAPWTPTLPLTTSMTLPSTVPTALANATTDLSTPYIDYVSTIPNLSTSLISLGRAYHREMNAPISLAINALQQSLSTLQSAMLQNELISSQAVLRTLRASSSLENAEVAWGRFLNLPGRAGAESTKGGDDAAQKRDIGAEGKTGHARGKYYTHKELWGRGRERWGDAVVRWEERVAGTGLGRVGRVFVG
ncbi:hypothetical protein CC86DRAFT_306266 [Ophiobolus disseminans]|uniref:Uncharacterized protein n=1 Tax=Ophiobolus disseminans TaxID=1469910 RepID=A0A6A6ZFH6_9PLEO|nr:hypothetical protein CC86DRAFT_306266 [Ophiobolus disseminans]